jgi:AraC-like DNA-binding protein
MSLDRNDFGLFDEALEAAYTGKLNIEDAIELHSSIFEIATRALPKPEPVDPRIQRLLALLDENPRYTLEELAAVVKLSYKRASYLFAEVMGLPLRSYLLWKKLHSYESMAGAYGPARSMTEIAHAAGFVDSAHLCRTFQEVFGAPPSYFFANRNVKVFSWQRHNPMSPTTQLQTRGNPLDRDRLVIEPHRSTASLGHVA